MKRFSAFCISLLSGFVFIYSYTEGETSLEFGSILRQQLTLTQPTDQDVISLVKFAIQYAEKRFPWSVPLRISGKAKKHPEVTDLSKVNLIYSYDGVVPLYYETEISDRNGRNHGYSSMIMFGSLYRFQLLWKDKALRFIHNFTVSVYPRKIQTIFSHTFFIATENITESAKDPGYLTNLKKMQILRLPSQSFSQESSYTTLNNLNQWNTFTFESDHMTEAISQSDGAKECLGNGHECNDLYSNAGNVRYRNWKSRKFSVLSYNIWNMNPEKSKKDNYVRRMKLLKKVIADADADILGIQEVRYEEIKGEELGPSQIQTLTEWFPEYQYVFQPAQMQPNSLQEGRTEEGVAILSKFPIVSHYCKFLFRNQSNSADTHQRVLLHAEIMIPLSGKVHVLNTHLSLSHEAREQSVIQIWQYVKQLEGPVIFLGDLNAEPQERAVQYLNGKDVLIKDRSQLIDVWLAKHGSESNGFTYNPREELSKRPKHMLWVFKRTVSLRRFMRQFFEHPKRMLKLIDYMYIRPSDFCCQIDSCDILDNAKRGIDAASDHLPIKAVFSFQEKIETS